MSKNVTQRKEDKHRHGMKAIDRRTEAERQRKRERERERETDRKKQSDREKAGEVEKQMTEHKEKRRKGLRRYKFHD